MKKSLYIRFCHKALKLLLILLPYFFYAPLMASPLHKSDFVSHRPAEPLSGSNSAASSNYNQNSNSTLTPLAFPPSITCHSNIKTVSDFGKCGATVYNLKAFYTDPDNNVNKLTWTITGKTNGNSPLTGINNLSSYDFNLGISTVTYTVTDATNLSVSCSFTVEVTDSEIPDITSCSHDTTFTIPFCTLQTGVVTLPQPTATDNCGVLSIFSNAPLQFLVGNTSVIWTVNDVNGNLNQCEQIVTVNTAPGIAINGSITPVSCFGSNDGTATAVASLGSPPYTYSWNTVPVQTSATATNLSAGIYTVTVSDINNCSATTSVTVTQPVSALAVAVTGQVNVSCFGSSTGSVTVAGNGGTAGYQYSIDGVLFQASGTFANLAAGTYTITVKDSKNCLNTTSVIITQPATRLSASIISQTKVACMGTATGAVTVAGSGGTAPYQYSINGGAFQASGSFSSLLAGTYNIIAKDAGNCVSGIAVTILQSATLFTAVITSHINVTCAGQANGSATVTASGGTPPYLYSWNTIPVQTNATAINLTARAYTVTVTDAAGCVKTSNITITQPTPIVVSITKTDVLCRGQFTGSATAEASGGIPPYTYAWLTTPVQTTATISNLAAGTYSVAVFDSLGCLKAGFVTITQPSANFTATITSQVNVPCVGNNIGSITVSGSGGFVPYQFNINGGEFQSSGTFSGLTGGSYTIIAKDANNCQVEIPATITAPSIPLAVSISSKSNVLCSGQTNGSATVTATGGTSPYLYSWNTTPVQTTATAINLAVRAYTVTVTDALGCITTANVNITQPTPIAVSITKSDVICRGQFTGSATAVASGGIPPYTYAWLTTPVQTTATISNLAAGTYSVAVFDSLGCLKAGFVTITQPAVIFTASITSQVNIPCVGNNIGSVTVSGDGGFVPYQFNINGGEFQSSGTFSGLAGGSYTIIAKDANSCQVEIPATITAPAKELAASISNKTNVLCTGQVNGSATVTATGGTSPYLYSWNTSPVQTTATAINLAIRSYIVTVTDALGCVTTANVTITQPTPIAVSITKTNVLCKGELTGSATAVASGGIPPYTYAWLTTPVQTTATISNLAAGTYSVAVFDSLGCLKAGFVTITEPATKFIASITDQVNIQCSGNNIGSVTVDGSGGDAPYEYNINGGAFQSSGTFSNLSEGPYTVIAKDANYCEVIVPVNITPPLNGITASVLSHTDNLCAGLATGSATVTASGGTAPITFSWNTIPVQTSQTITALPAGTYVVTSTDNGGCFVKDTVIITEPAILTGSISNQVNFDCATGTNGSVTITAAGGTPGYQYSLDGGAYQLSGDFANLAPGNHTVTLQDANNCTGTVAVEIIISGTVKAINDTFTATEDIPLNGNVMTNDMVLCNLPITVTANTDPQHGSVTLNSDGSFVYTPSKDYNGPDSFTYTLSDKLGETSTATVNIQVNPVNDPPVTFNNSLSVAYNVPLTGNLLLNGSYDPDSTVLSINTIPVKAPANGTFVVAAGGVYTYKPNLNFSGTDMVIVSVCDAGIPLPSACTNDTIFITVLQPNLPPLTINEHLNICSDTSFVGTVSNGGTVFNGETDPENNLPFTLNNVPVQGPLHGAFSFTNLAAGTFNYTPNPGYSGSDYVIIGICDSGTPVACNNDTVFFEISLPVIANAGLNQMLCNSDVASLVGNSPLPGTGSWAYVSGPGTPTVLPAIGNVAVATGLIAGIEPYVFSYTIKNNGCISTSTMTVTNYYPASPAYAGEDQRLCSDSADISTNLAAKTPQYGTAVWTQLSGPTTAIFGDTTNPNTYISGLTTGEYTFQWEVHNGVCSSNADVVTIRASKPVNANAGSDQAIIPGTATTLSGTATGGSGIYAWSWQPSELLLDATGQNPATLAIDAETNFILTVLDIISGCTGTDTVAILIDNSANPLVAHADYDSTLVNSAVTINVLLNDTRPYGDTLIVSLCGYPVNGIVVLNSDSTITYTPHPDYFGDDSFCYKICDKNKPLLCSDTLVYIHIKQPSLDDLHPYSGISPNSDGLNDIWKIKGVEKYPDNTVIIFNRWGDKLREFSGYNNASRSWDGRNEKGDLLPDGTYFYILDVRNVGVLKGWIYLRGK